MTFCHRQIPPVSHRDLKSPNIFLTSTLESGLVAKVADLGMATVLSQRAASVDNCIWLAPEAISNNLCDKSVDVYAFGIIMWELLTLRFPFDEELRENHFFSALGKKIVNGLRPV